MSIRSRPTNGAKRRRVRRRFNQQQQPMQQMSHRSIRIPISNGHGNGHTFVGPSVII